MHTTVNRFGVRVDCYRPLHSQLNFSIYSTLPMGRQQGLPKPWPAGRRKRALKSGHTGGSCVNGLVEMELEELRQWRQSTSEPP